MAIMARWRKEPPDTILTVDMLAHAIQNTIDRKGLREEEAKAMAHHVLNFFGYSERIIDNILEPEDRDAFYMLEDTGIMTTEREETTLYDGREWRIHYWLFRKDRVFEILGSKFFEKQKKVSELVTTVYDTVPETVWKNSTDATGAANQNVTRRTRIRKRKKVYV